MARHLDGGAPHLSSAKPEARFGSPRARRWCVHPLPLAGEGPGVRVAGECAGAIEPHLSPTECQSDPRHLQTRANWLPSPAQFG